MELTRRDVLRAGAGAAGAAAAAGMAGCTGYREKPEKRRRVQRLEVGRQQLAAGNVDWDFNVPGEAMDTYQLDYELEPEGPVTQGNVLVDVDLAVYQEDENEPQPVEVAVLTQDEYDTMLNGIDVDPTFEELYRQGVSSHASMDGVVPPDDYVLVVDNSDRLTSGLDGITELYDPVEYELTLTAWEYW